jgi:intracellular sulfur oxidation DsrE/DsrF family protein
MLCVASSAYGGKVDVGTDGLKCPDQAIQEMNIEFGIGTSELTQCIQNRKELKSVFAWNLTSVNKKSGLAQQAQVTRNSVNNWEGMYDMEINKDSKVTVIAYSGGGRWLLTDEAYNRTYNVTTGNPTAKLTASLIARGIIVYMCQNTMRGNSWVTTDLLPGVQMVPSGAVSLLDHMNSGYKYINP